MNYLLGFDFDGTIAQTFEKSPKGIGVTEAYRLAISDIFGPEVLAIYDTQGGLKNSAPSELIHSLMGEGGNELLVRNAEQFFNTHKEELINLVPEGKGVPLEWTPAQQEKIMGELLVRQKLHYLMDEIGTQYSDGSCWPRPCKNFAECWQTIQELKRQGIPINTAVISSGHDLFINKVFDIWGLPHPDILVTEDDIRGRTYPKELERRTKPGELQLALAHEEWLRRQHLTGMDFNMGIARETRKGMIYFGDDEKRWKFSLRSQHSFWFI